MIIKDDTTGKNIVGNPKVEFINSKIHNFFLKLKKIIIGSTIPQKLFRTYFLIVIISAVLLCCPFCLQVVDGVQINGFKNKNYNFIKALFVACSAFSNTGLTPIIVFKYFNFFGQLVLLLTIEIGGMGTIALFY